MAVENPKWQVGVGKTEQRRRFWSNARAGLLRLVFATVGMFAVYFVPGLKPHALYFELNLALALIFQVMIVRGVRHLVFALVMGLVDVLFVTCVVHLMGSTQTALTFFYLVIPIVAATTTTRRRLSMTIATVAALCYLGMLILESLGTISFAPAVPGLPRPSSSVTFFSGLVVTIAILSVARFVSQLIYALREANQRLRDQSQRDELTTLYNRRYLHARLDAELARVKRGGQLTLLMVDLDGFKRVNDGEGHEAGDKVLQAVALSLVKATRKSDVVARFGGDEFVVLLPDTPLDGCQAVAARIVDHARDAGRQTYPAIPVTASVGIALGRPDEDAASLIRRADEGVYAAKRGGGDRVSLV